MVHLQGLDGVKKKVVKARFFRSVSQCITLLRTNRFLTAADDRGAINLYKDDEGNFRGQRCFMMGIRSEKISNTKKGIIDWLKVELPNIK